MNNVYLLVKKNQKNIIFNLTIFFLWVCETGKFGENCENSCHCKTSGCGIEDGHCYDPGCEDGWSGDRCDSMYLYIANIWKRLKII